MTNRPTNSTTPNNFKCIQWNARGLTKAKLEDFRNFLSSVKPEIVMLSETHWNNLFNVKFNSYHVLKKNRPNRLGGGVAILVNKHVVFSQINLIHTATVEAIGVSVMSTTNNPTDFISIYVPKGDCEVHEMEYVFNRRNVTVVGGDFNAHFSMWESSAQANKAGRSVYEALLSSHNMGLILLSTWVHE